MKIDAEIKITNTPNPELIENGKRLDIPVDIDYINDFDDIINDVEIELYNKYGTTFIYNINFDIENAADICDEYFS